MPVIQRGIYYHLLGRKKGQPYQINSIKNVCSFLIMDQSPYILFCTVKGATLYFNAKDHPSLSNKGGNNLLGIRIISVDEDIKRQML